MKTLITDKTFTGERKKKQKQNEKKKKKINNTYSLHPKDHLV